MASWPHQPSSGSGGSNDPPEVANVSFLDGSAGVCLERVGPETELEAAKRLVGVDEGDREVSARRLLAAAPRHGIDFSMAWGTFERAKAGRGMVRCRQVCLSVVGSGRTAMVFLSAPDPRGEFGGEEAAHRERVACLVASTGAMRVLTDEGGRRLVDVIQALPDPGEDWSVRACADAGFVRVGLLRYMRANVPGTRPVRHDSREGWPSGVEVVSVASIPESRRDGVLIEALDSTYEATLDCPELCGMRRTSDILESHRQTGVHDPGIWWVAFDGGSPRGTLLLSRCPEQKAVELVYLGLSPVLRGRGIARRLMDLAFRAAATSRYSAMTCAVDERNTPAVMLYESCGFAGFSQRVAMVLRV